MLMSLVLNLKQKLKRQLVHLDEVHQHELAEDRGNAEQGEAVADV